jgi:osmotically inducible lipoprotein OsmB
MSRRVFWIIERCFDMRVLFRAAVFIGCAAMLAGCSDMTRQQQRVLSGGAIGAAGGAVITAVVGGPVLVGSAIGAGVGAVAGAVTH